MKLLLLVLLLNVSLICASWQCGTSSFTVTPLMKSFQKLENQQGSGLASVYLAKRMCGEDVADINDCCVMHDACYDEQVISRRRSDTSWLDSNPLRSSDASDATTTSAHVSKTRPVVSVSRKRWSAASGSSVSTVDNGCSWALLGFCVAVREYGQEAYDEASVRRSII